MNIRSSRKARSEKFQAALLLSSAVVFLMALFVVPLIRMLLLSVWDDGLTTIHFQNVLTNYQYWRSLLWTFNLAFLTSVACILFGFPVAYTMIRARSTFRLVLFICILLPLWTSALVRTFALISVLGREGPINSILMYFGVIESPLRLLFNNFSVLIGTVQIMLPYMVITLYGSMMAIDRSTVDAAETLGASRLRSFFLVYVPQTTPGLVAGFIIVFTISLGFYITPAVLGGPGVQPFVVLVEQSMNQLFNWPMAAALSVFLLAATLTLYFVFRRFIGHGTDLKNDRSVLRLFRLMAYADTLLTPLRKALRRMAGDRRGRRKRGVPIATPLAIIVTIAVVLPILFIVFTAFSGTYAVTYPPQSLSLRWFEMYFSRHDWVLATLNSFKIGALTAILTVLLVLPAALGLRGVGPRIRVIAMTLLVLPMIVPHVVYGVAAYFHLVAFGLAGTSVGLVLAHTVLAITPAMLLVLSAVQGFDRNLEYAAASLGASPWRQFLHIILPFVAPVVLAAALVAFVISFEDLGVALFLTSGEVMTLPRRMYDSILIERDPRVTAASVVVIGVSIVLLGCFHLTRVGAGRRSEPRRGG